MPNPIQARPRSRCGRRALAVALAWALGLPMAQGQALHELLPHAIEHDATLEAARLDVRAAQLRLSQTEAARRPTLAASLNANANRVQNAATSPNPVRGHELQLALQAQHNLVNRAEQWAVEVASRQLQQAMAQQDGVRRELVWRVTQAYVEVLAARDAARVQTEARRTTEQLALTLGRMLKAGTATVSDLREAQSRLDLAAAQEQASLGELRTRAALLAEMVGRDGVVVRPVGDWKWLDPADPGPLAAWLDRAREAASELAVARLAVEVARAEAQRIQAGGQWTAAWTASVGGGYAGSSARLQTDDGLLRTQVGGSQRVASIGLTVNLPLDANAALSLRHREALAQVARQEAQVRAAQQALDAQVRQSYLGLVALRQQLQSLAAAEDSSRLALEATERGLRAGLRLSIDVLNAQSQVFSVRRDHVRLRYEALLSWLRLQHLASRADTALPR